MEKSKKAGLSRWAFSLDGSIAKVHDHFRGTSGSYDLTVRNIQYLKELKMPIQINTTVSRYNFDDLENIAKKIESFDAELWSVFFLIPTGRGQTDDMITAKQHEEVFEWLYELNKKSSYDIKTTAAPHYRRYVLQQNTDIDKISKNSNLKDNIPKLKDHIGRAERINDGKGFAFVSHLGDVYPSGVLPVIAGNIHETHISEIYRNSPIFTSLRNPAMYKGKCGVCEYINVCGGSRARAYALTGDYLESDPSCIYQPKSK